ncbi:unnamed protein product [Vitrella brassicaformis CCMP3155]|uniref:SAC3/GANP/THP3 conserved domain-containing protein n=1 Tax=Vitrella brassicaformis (strain CCMP3155) TaxID=1169540 RepID=A0A0G4GDQ1_VITBC|nr:unnamed protein product [Vitrella brassicaformis CCMP3155]|eukprot:CEM27543.1 unnamed protein product [Vitrella brassicaformis CCMP3155]
MQEYVRSTGDPSSRTQDRRSLRPPPILRLATKTLLGQLIASVPLEQWESAYDFASNRLRAIRHDAIVQSAVMDTREMSWLFECSVRFLAASSYLMRDEFVKTTQPALHDQALFSCMAYLMNIYRSRQAASKGRQMDPNGDLVQRDDSATVEFSAAYLVLSIMDEQRLQSRLKQILRLGKRPCVGSAWRLVKAVSHRSFVRTFRIASTLPLLLRCIFYRRLTRIRLNALQTLLRAHGSPKGTRYPLDALARQWRFDSVEQARAFIQQAGLQCVDDGSSFLCVRGATIDAKAVNSVSWDAKVLLGEEITCLGSDQLAKWMLAEEDGPAETV